VRAADPANSSQRGMGEDAGDLKSYKKTNNSANAVVGCSHIKFRMAARTPPPHRRRRDEFAALHAISRLARTSSDGGTSS
jgi:hypothetical protein